MEFPKGKCLALDLSHGPAVKGFVHSVDRKAGLLCVEELSTAKFILIALKNVMKTTLVAHPPHKRNWPEKVEDDPARVRSDERRVLRARHARYCEIGVGVSPEGQAIFDMLAKNQNMQCRWQNETIVIFDSVHLLPPYTVNEIISKDGDAKLKDRVRFVLEQEHAKIVADIATNGLQK